jgi:hypothetical protein
MTTLAANKSRAYEGVPLRIEENALPVIAADIVYEGAAIGVVPASGHARPLAAGDTFGGFATRKADNALGTAAAISCDRYQQGFIQLPVAGAVITDVGQRRCTGRSRRPRSRRCSRRSWAGIVQILSFKDDRGEPMNETAREFLVKVPVTLYPAAAAAVSALSTKALAQNFNPNLIEGLQISVQMNARLTWTDKFSVHRTDSPIKGFIRQTEQEVEMKAKAEGSEFEFDNDAWEFGIDAWRGVGYGYWQRSCLVTMT